MSVEITDDLKAELRAKGVRYVVSAGALGLLGFRAPPYADYKRFIDRYSDEKGVKTSPLEDLLATCCVHPDDKGATLKRALEAAPGKLTTWGGKLLELARGAAEDEGKEL